MCLPVVQLATVERTPAAEAAELVLTHAGRPGVGAPCLQPEPHTHISQFLRRSAAGIAFRCTKGCVHMYAAVRLEEWSQRHT